jgi:hypothetical protein
MPKAIILTVALPKVRPAVRIAANSMPACVPELRDRCVFVESFGKPNSVDVNASALRQCARWVLLLEDSAQRGRDSFRAPHGESAERVSSTSAGGLSIYGLAGR